MSSKGIFSALSGAMAQNSRMETISNNIANSNTTSFKKDKQLFNEYLTANEKLLDVIQVPKVPASIESFYDMQGGDTSYVNANGSYTDYSQGTLKPTGNVFDIAIDGHGFFEVLTPQGVRLTRNGAFKMDANGRLVTKQGDPVLAAGQGAPEQRIIQLNQGQNMTVSFSGDVYSNGELSAKLAVVELDNGDALQKVGANNYKIKDNYNVQISQIETPRVQQGFLEGSNVNIVEEMTDMIAATRTFETTQEAIKAYDQMDDKLINVVMKTS